MATTKLYTPTQISIGTFLGSPFAGIYFLSSNFNALGKSKEVTLTAALGLLASILIVVASYYIPQKLWAFIPALFIPACYTAVAHTIATKQIVTNDDHTETTEHSIHSNLRVLGFTLLSFISFIVFSIAISLTLLKIERPDISIIRQFNLEQGDYPLRAKLLIEIQSQNNITSIDNLELLKLLTEEAFFIPHAMDVYSLITAPRITVQDDDLQVEYNVKRGVELTESTRALTESYMLNTPNILNRLYFPETNTAVIEVYTQIKENSGLAAIPQIIGQAEEIKRKYELQYPVNITLSGDYIESSLQSTRFINLNLHSTEITLTPQDNRRYRESNTIYDPTFSTQIDNLATWLRNQKEIEHVLTYSDTIKQINALMRNNTKVFNSIPESKELILQYILLYQMSLNLDNDFQTLVDVDGNIATMRITLKKEHKDRNDDVQDKITQWINTNTTHIRQIEE